MKKSGKSLLYLSLVGIYSFMKGTNCASATIKHCLAICLLMISAGAWAQTNYVFYNDTYGYIYNNNGIVGVKTDFDESCIWRANNTLGNTSRNIRSYIDDTKYLRGATNNISLGGSNNEWRGNGTYLQWRSGSSYYVKYSETAFDLSSTQNNGNRFNYYSVTITDASDFTFNISSPTAGAYIGQVNGTMTISAQASGNFRPAYYSFNNRYYYSTDGGETYTSNTNAPSQVSNYNYEYEIVSGGGNASISGNTVTYTKDAGHDVDVVVRVTATPQGYDDVKKTAECTFTLYSATVTAPTITPGPDLNQYTITGPANSTIKYTIDGTDIDASGSNGTTYSEPITITTPNTTIKAKAVREGKVSQQTAYTVANVTLMPPTITINDAGSVTINNPNGSVGTIYYTTDGTEPSASSTQYNGAFPVNNMQTVKAIVAGGTGYISSSIAEKQYKIESGISGGVVTLNDYEDHNWTYYSDPESPIKSLYPRNVKITYYGYGTKTMTTDNNNPDTNNMTDVASTAVGVSKYESENTFVYYKTLERYVPINNLEEGTPQNIYPYDLIPNPFSKRPTYGNNATTKWRGFYGWRVKSISGGKIYNNVNKTGEITDGTILTTEYQKLYFLPNDAGETNANNATSMTVEFEAIWARAYRVETNANAVNTNISSDTFQGGVSYERNFLVINAGTTGNTSISNNNQNPVTVMMVEPDGSTDYRATTRYINPTYVIAQNSLKFEWMNMQVSNTLSANAKNLVVGRGVLPGGESGSYPEAPLGDMSATANNPNPTVTAAQVNGLGTTTNGNSNYSTSVNFYLRIESGVYNNLFYVSSNTGYRGRMSSSATCHVTGFFGNDYDRAKNNNDRMVTKEAVLEGTSNGFNNTSSRYLETMHLTMKSGIIGTNYNNAIANSTYAPGPTNACYVAVGSTATACGLRRFIVEGGSISCITGGMETWGTVDESIKNNLMTDIRVKYNSLVRSAAFGGPANAEHFGLRRMVFTGGQVNGWVAGACNGNSDNGGQLKGSTQVYVGGNAIIGDKSKTAENQITVNGSKGGNVFGAGRGRASSTTTGEVTYGTNVVVADDAYIVNNVYGGGDLGYALTTANVHVLGGEVMGGVYGGANQKKGENINIVMRGGLVHGGVYGGSNSSGTIEGNVTMQINGGQVGTPENPANIHGGGYGQPTVISGNVDINIGTYNTTTKKTTGNAIIYGDVYGGSALGSVNDAATDHTNVTLNAGTINGSLYGGALGSNTVAANVYGPVAVVVNGGKVVGENSAVYGCNNINGAPQRAVSVTVNHTDSHNVGSDEDDPVDDTYAINAVYGGGNRANYTYGIPTVTVNNCDNSIKYVYGGGNQATVPATSVTINGGNIIDNVFGGGNNANVTGTATGVTLSDGDNGNKGTRVNINGGRILNVYGGNNNGGAITGTIKVNVAEPANATCPVNVSDLYGGGNKAASNAGQITIGKCTNITRVFGGANQADVTGPINLNIVDGNIGTVFGGNNNSGTVTGAITVNVNWNGKDNRSLGSVYGGGNLAEYTGNPTVNIINATTTGNVFGGGLGKSAVVVGDPVVNIGSWKEGKVSIGGDVFGGGDLAAVEGNPTVTIRDCGTIIKGDLYGGGNAAPVYSTNTTMWGGIVRGNVFGGGNGSDATKNEKGAQVGYTRNDETTAGTGNAVTNIYGGTVGTWSESPAGCADNTGGIFGGSNTTGNIVGNIIFTLDQRKYDETNSDLINQFGKPAEGDSECPLVIKEVYGSGNNAAYAGAGIEFTLGCVAGLDEIYGGAKKADMDGNIHLIISSGHFKKVFGGNNLGGCINGSIKVSIDETGCNPVIIDELYCGGNQAAYSVYGYDTDGKVLTTGTKLYNDPKMEVISCTHIGQVFGGGLGASAVMVGNPIVNVNEIKGVFADDDAVKTYVNKDKLGSIGEVFGGGNAADIIGDTHVNICTVAKVAHVSETDMTKKEACGANITGNVYGGGSQANVTGKTFVTVGQKKTPNP